MRRQITIGEINDAQSHSDNASRYHSMPGIVQAFYPGQQGVSPPTVDVQPAVQDVRLDPATGALIFEPWPVLPKVPVAFLRGGGFAIWYSLHKGDDVQLVAHDLDPSTFRATGAQAKPVLTRRNSGAFWWAYPGSIADPNGLPDPGNALCIGIPGGGIIAIGQDGKINLGGASPTDAIALASKTDAVWNALAQALSTAPSAPLTPAALLALLQTAWGGTPAPALPPPTTTASQTVKATP